MVDALNGYTYNTQVARVPMDWDDLQVMNLMNGIPDRPFTYKIELLYLSVKTAFVSTTPFSNTPFRFV